jgi:hypothetical protein
MYYTTVLILGRIKAQIYHKFFGWLWGKAFAIRKKA